MINDFVSIGVYQVFTDVETSISPVLSPPRFVPPEPFKTRCENCCRFSELMEARKGASYTNGRIKGGSLSIKISRIELNLKAK